MPVKAEIFVSSAGGAEPARGSGFQSRAIPLCDWGSIENTRNPEVLKLNFY